jgi:hypothetical protein
MWQNMRAYQNITKNPCPQINAEILMVSTMDYTMSIPLCPLLLMIPSVQKSVSPVKSIDEMKKCPAFRRTKHGHFDHLLQMYSFRYNSQIKCFRIHVHMDIFLDSWYSCPKYIYIYLFYYLFNCNWVVARWQ